jgi:hypothetical protein
MVSLNACRMVLSILFLLSVLPFDRGVSGQRPKQDEQDGFDNMMYSTFLGADGNEAGVAIALDGSGAIYLTGDTTSPDFPITDGAFDMDYNGGRRDVYVVKLSADGSELLYSTFLGGSDTETGLSIAVDASGAAYVTGATDSADFPTTPGAFDTTYNGGRDVFVVKLSADGSSLEYATFLGGSDWDQGYGIVVDSSGTTHITGETSSSSFPVTEDAFDPSYNGGLRDGFAAKMNISGTDLEYSTFLGGTERDHGYDISVDGDGAAYVIGDTFSTDFPVTAGAFDTSHNGGRDCFVVKLQGTGTDLVYATYLGGDRWEQGYAITVDGSGAAVVTGSTRSADFPCSPNAFDTTHNGRYDAIVAKLNPMGSGLEYSTFLGGNEIDGGLGVAVGASGEIFVTGDTESSDFPTTPDAYDTTYNGDGRDAFVVQLDTQRADLAYSTFLGGNSDGWGFDIAAGASDVVYVAGGTSSPDFPTTPDAYDPSHNGGFDALVTSLLMGVPVPVGFSPDSPDGQVGEWHSFAGDYRDPDGWQDIASAHLVLGRNEDDRKGLTVKYETAEDALYLRDLVAGWLGPCSPGERMKLYNGVVQLDCRSSTVSNDGDHILQVTWHARFIRPVDRPRTLNAYLRAVDQLGLDSG